MTECTVFYNIIYGFQPFSHRLYAGYMAVRYRNYKNFVFFLYFKIKNGIFYGGWIYQYTVLPEIYHTFCGRGQNTLSIYNPKNPNFRMYYKILW